jgi:hypothetical protein
MDSNNANQDQSQQVTPPQNDNQDDTTASQEQPAADTQNDQGTQQPDTTNQTEPQSEQTNTSPQDAPDQTPTAQQANPATQNDAPAAAAPGNYIEDVGEDLIDLLDEIEANDNLIDIVANEMSLDKDRVKSILTKLLDKIDQEQITAEEIALIMASTAVDEVPAEESPEAQK